jgi:hypothetical protein
MVMSDEPRFGSWHKTIYENIDQLFEGDVHVKRVNSLANAVLGVMTGASLAVAVIGQSLAQARGLCTKHALKQVDRLLNNEKFIVWDYFAYWVVNVLGERKDIVVAMDWTDFDPDGQTTLVLSIVTSHGRATPVLWLTVWKEELKGMRNSLEDACLVRLSEVLPEGVKVTILADRGFGDHKLFQFLNELGFQFIIRFRGNIRVAASDGEVKMAAEWVGKDGRSRKLKGAMITGSNCPIGSVVCVHAKGMKEAWCLAISDPSVKPKDAIDYYSRRWTIEPSFRDTKDLRFGMGLGSVRVSTPERRDRLLFLNALAIQMLTILGAAGESLGLDRTLKSNTSKHRTHSLFRQGCMLYDLIPNMPELRLLPLMERFAEMLQQCRVSSVLFSIL